MQLSKIISKAKKLRSIPEFAEFSRKLTSEEVYDLLESTSQDLRNEIYYTFWTPAENPEPARSAMRQMGARYVVDSLMQY